MAVSHVFSNAVADWTGTVTVFNSQGSTATVAATNLVRPVDWNSGHNQFYTLSGNTNNASTASGTNVVLQGVGAVTMIGSTGTIGVSVAPPVSHSHFCPWENHGQVQTTTFGNSVMRVQFFTAPNVVFDRIGFRVHLTNNTNSTGSVTLRMYVGLYTRNGSSLSMLSSTSTAYDLTFSGTVRNSIQAGNRNATIGWTQTLTEGDYWLAFVSSTSTAGANLTLSLYAGSGIVSTLSGNLNEAATGTAQRVLGWGGYTTNTTGMPTIAFSEIQGPNPNDQRQPYFFLLSQSA